MFRFRNAALVTHFNCLQARNALIGALSGSRDVRFGLVQTHGVKPSVAASNAWCSILNLLYGSTGHLSAHEGYTGKLSDQAHKFKAYVKRLCEHITKNKLTLDNQDQWDLEIKAFADEAAKNQSQAATNAQLNLQREADRATWHRVEDRFGLNPPPYVVPANSNRSDRPADSENGTGPSASADNHQGSAAAPLEVLDNDQSLVAAVAEKSPKNRLGAGRIQWDRANSHGHAFAMANSLMVQFSENLMAATARRNANAQNAAPADPMVASPSKKAARLNYFLHNTNPSPAGKEELENAIRLERGNALAIYKTNKE
jgi:hypothetical protein